MKHLVLIVAWLCSCQPAKSTSDRHRNQKSGGITSIGNPVEESIPDIGELGLVIQSFVRDGSQGVYIYNLSASKIRLAAPEAIIDGDTVMELSPLEPGTLEFRRFDQSFLATYKLHKAMERPSTDTYSTRSPNDIDGIDPRGFSMSHPLSPAISGETTEIRVDFDSNHGLRGLTLLSSETESQISTIEPLSVVADGTTVQPDQDKLEIELTPSSSHAAISFRLPVVKIRALSLIWGIYHLTNGKSFMFSHGIIVNP